MHCDIEAKIVSSVLSVADITKHSSSSIMDELLVSRSEIELNISSTTVGSYESNLSLK
jgi:hypothetical protein